MRLFEELQHEGLRHEVDNEVDSGVDSDKDVSDLEVSIMYKKVGSSYMYQVPYKNADQKRYE